MKKITLKISDTQKEAVQKFADSNSIGFEEAVSLLIDNGLKSSNFSEIIAEADEKFEAAQRRLTGVEARRTCLLRHILH